MAWYDENRMAVEGQREQEERYRGSDKAWFFENDLPTYCELYGCEDCPKYGDDCDGKEDSDDRVAYYERQGDEYVYYDEDEHELYREPA